MPAQSLTHHRPQDAYHRVTHAIAQTTDVGFFVKPDAMSEALTAHATGPTELHSNNVKRSYNGRQAAKAGLGVTGGHVEGAQGDRDVNYGNASTVKARRKLQRIKTRRNQAARRTALVAELRARGYNV